MDGAGGRQGKDDERQRGQALASQAHHGLGGVWAEEASRTAQDEASPRHADEEDDNWRRREEERHDLHSPARQVGTEDLAWVVFRGMGEATRQVPDTR